MTFTSLIINVFTQHADEEIIESFDTTVRFNSSQTINSPTNVTVTGVFSTVVELKWSGADDGRQYHYNVYCYHPECPYCSHLPDVMTVVTNTSMATVTGLLLETMYACCVTAQFGQESLCSEEINFTTLSGSEFYLRM